MMAEVPESGYAGKCEGAANLCLVRQPTDTAKTTPNLRLYARENFDSVGGRRRFSRSLSFP
jgi:hypothetical protein